MIWFAVKKFPRIEVNCKTKIGDSLPFYIIFDNLLDDFIRNV